MSSPSNAGPAGPQTTPANPEVPAGAEPSERADPERRRAWERKIVKSRGTTPRLRVRNREAATAFVLGGLGLALLVVGLVDVIVRWLPSRPEDSTWMFTTLSETLGAMMTPAVGLGFLAYAGVRSPSMRGGRVRAMAAGLLLGALLVAIPGLIWATVAPEVLGRATGGALAAMQDSVVRTAVAAVVYPLLFAVIGIYLWRSVDREA